MDIDKAGRDNRTVCIELAAPAAVYPANLTDHPAFDRDVARKWLATAAVDNDAAPDDKIKLCHRAPTPVVTLRTWSSRAYWPSSPTNLDMLPVQNGSVLLSSSVIGPCREPSEMARSTAV